MPTKDEGFPELLKLYQQILLMADPYAIKYAHASFLTHRLKAEPYWTFIEAPSSSGKTEILKSFGLSKQATMLTTFSSNSLISGAKAGGGKEASLLLRIQNGIIVTEDFTPIMSEAQEEKTKLMGQLRSVHTGSYSRAFGTGETITWEGKISMMAGVTKKIHQFREIQGQLGERFVIYCMLLPDRREVMVFIRELRKKEGYKEEIQKQILEKVAWYHDDFLKLDGINVPVFDDEFSLDVDKMVELVTRARSHVERDYRDPKRPVQDKPELEGPGRVSNQLQSLGQALWIMDYHQGIEKFSQHSKEIVIKTALDSITKVKRYAMQELAKFEEVHSTGLAVKLDLPTETVTRWLQDLNALGVAERIKHSGPQGDKWRIIPHYREVLAKWLKVQTVNTVLDEETAEQEKAIDSNNPARIATEEFPDPEDEIDDTTNQAIDKILL